MNRRGFALVATLWLMVVLTGVTALSLAGTRKAVWTARNRILLRRAEWARDACLAIVRVRYSRSAPRDGQAAPELSPLPRTDLGRGAWCRVEIDHPERRLNLNTSDPATLRGLFGRDDLTDAVLDWRDAEDFPRAAGAESAWYAREGRPVPRNGPLASVDELRLVKGFDSALVGRLRPLLTTDGDGRLDANTAPLELLALLPGLGAEAIAAIESRRPMTGLEPLYDGLSRAALAEFLAHQDGLRRQLSFGVSEYVVDVVGGIDGTPISARARVVLVPTERRLAVVRVEAS